MPRVRTAGNAKAIPNGTVAATPMSRPSQNGMPCVAMSRPVTQAPKPASAYCARDN